MEQLELEPVFIRDTGITVVSLTCSLISSLFPGYFNNQAEPKKPHGWQSPQ